MKRAIAMAFVLSTVCLGACDKAGLTFAMLAADINKPHDPISNDLRKKPSWNKVVSLIPGPFHVGQSRKEAEAILLKAGYTRKDQSVRPGDVHAGTEVYGLSEQGPPCNISREVHVVFDADDRVSRADGASYEAGCL